MRLADRYIIKEFIKPFFISLLIFIFLYLLIQFLEDLGDILKEKQKLYPLFKNYLFQVPSVFVHLSPIAMLLSSLFVLGTFSRYNETIAFQVAGISLYRIFFPFLLLGFLFSGISFFINDRIVPPLSLKIEKNEKKIPEITFYTKEKMLYAKLFDREERALFDLQILSYSDGALRRIINAQKALYLNPVRDASRIKYGINGVNKEIWILRNGISRQFDRQGRCISQSEFNSLKIDLRLTPKALLTGYRKPEQLSFNELLFYLRRLRKDGLHPAAQLVDLYSKTAVPFINLFVLFLVLPFLLSFHLPASRFFGIGFSILACFLYYWIFSLGIALGKEGLLYPFLGAWFANFFFGTIGGFLLVVVRK